MWVRWGPLSRAGPAQPHPRARGQLPNQPPHWLRQVQGKRLLDCTLASPLLQPKRSTGRGPRAVGWGQPAPWTWCSWWGTKDSSVGACGQTGVGSKACRTVPGRHLSLEAPQSLHLSTGADHSHCGNLTPSAHASPGIRHVHRHGPDSIFTPSPWGRCVCVFTSKETSNSTQ